MAIAPQTTGRNRRAVTRMRTPLCEAKGSRLSTGTNTSDRKIDPPIQLTAASTWSQTNKTIIPAADPLISPHSSCRFVSKARENRLVTEACLVEQSRLNDLNRKD